MAKGRKTGGRAKGTPNKTTQVERELFKMVYDNRLQDLDRWLQETGDGYEAIKILVVDKEVQIVKHMVRDPGRAADILTRMAEHFTPKLQRIEKGIADASDAELLAEVRRRAEAADGKA
jgi:hypothetical protein